MADNDERKLQKACGVFACVTAEGISEEEADVANTICLGLVGLQHR